MSVLLFSNNTATNYLLILIHRGRGFGLDRSAAVDRTQALRTPGMLHAHGRSGHHTGAGGDVYHASQLCLLHDSSRFKCVYPLLVCLFLISHVYEISFIFKTVLLLRFHIHSQKDPDEIEIDYTCWMEYLI